jgi:endonuclease YncB( thermonuclease family)
LAFHRSGCRLHCPRRPVFDGDTFEILHNQHPERIRLSGIDCPEKGQAFELLADPVAVSDTGVVDITLG